MHLDRSRTTSRAKSITVPCSATPIVTRRQSQTTARSPSLPVFGKRTPGIALALKHKNDLEALKENFPNPLQLRQGLSFGAIFLLHQLAQRSGSPAPWDGAAGTISVVASHRARFGQGSRLSAVRYLLLRHLLRFLHYSRRMFRKRWSLVLLFDQTYKPISRTIAPDAYR